MILSILLAAASLAVTGPPARDILARADRWAEALPAREMRWALAEDGKAIGSLVLGADRRLVSKPSGLATSKVVRLWGALLRGDAAAAVRGAGCQLETTRLYHLHRRIVVIVGAGPGETQRPQVWFDRDTGAPVRIVLGDDLMLMAYDAPHTRGLFPGIVRWRSGGRQVRGAVR